MENKIFGGKVVKELRSRGIGSPLCRFCYHQIISNTSKVVKDNSESRSKVLRMREE